MGYKPHIKLRADGKNLTVRIMEPRSANGRSEIASVRKLNKAIMDEIKANGYSFVDGTTIAIQPLLGLLKFSRRE